MKAIAYYFKFSGRISVGKYWLTGIMPGTILSILGIIVDVNIFEYEDIFQPVSTIIFSLWFLPLLSVLFRRCHDLDLSAVFLLWLFVPLVNIWAGLKLAFVEGTPESNRFDTDHTAGVQAKQGMSRIFLMLLIAGLALTLLATRYQSGYRYIGGTEILFVLQIYIIFSSVFAASFIEIYFCSFLLHFVLASGISHPSDFDLYRFLSDYDTGPVFLVAAGAALVGFCVNYATRRLRNKFSTRENAQQRGKHLSHVEILVGAVLLMIVLSVYIMKPPTVGTVRRTEESSKLMRIAINAQDEKVCRAATLKITDESVLGQIAAKAEHTSVQYDALGRLTNQSILADVALSAEYRDVQYAALERITDQSELARIAVCSSISPARWNNPYRTPTDREGYYSSMKYRESENEWDIPLAAMWRITDRGILLKVANESPYDAVKQAAARRL